MKQAQCSSLESEGKTRWDSKFRSYNKMNLNEDFLRNDPDAANVLEDIPNGIYKDISEELEFHLKLRKDLEKRGVRLHMLLVVLDKIEKHIAKLECTEQQKVL